MNKQVTLEFSEEDSAFILSGIYNETFVVQNKEDLKRLIKRHKLKHLSIISKDQQSSELINDSLLDSLEKTENNSIRIKNDTKADFDKSESSTRERESFLSTSSSVNNSIRIKKYTKENDSLSVWKKIQFYLQHPEELEDETALKRLTTYSKRALFIIHVLDVFQAFTVYEAHRKSRDVAGLKIASRKTVGDLLKDLYVDGFLDLEILPRNNNIEPKFYSVKGFKERYPEKYERGKIRHKRVDNYTYKNLHEQKNTRIETDTLEKIKDNATKISLAQKEGFAEARKIEQEEIMRVAEIKTEEHRAKKEEERQQSREEEKIIRHPELNPEFAEKYVEGMAKFKKIYFEEKRTKNEQIAQQNYSEAIDILRADLLKQQKVETSRADAQLNGSKDSK